MSYAFILTRCPICGGPPAAIAVISEGVAGLTETTSGRWDLEEDPDVAALYSDHRLRDDSDRPRECLLSCGTCPADWWTPFTEGP